MNILPRYPFAFLPIIRRTSDCMVEGILPMPPTDNSLYRNLAGRGRVMTKAGNVYVKHMRPSFEAFALEDGISNEPQYLTIDLYFPDRRRRDIQNYGKCFIDLFQPDKKKKYRSLLLDDSQFEEVSFRRGPIHKPAYIHFWMASRLDWWKDVPERGFSDLAEEVFG